MKKLVIVISILTAILSGCTETKKDQKPNVILMMADDMGYECLSVYGSLSYQTPVLDKLATEGIRFENCISQPLCTPSRVKIMTGLYNYRNYEFFGYLNTNQTSFGNLMKEAGYVTCIAGKWQLNGLSYPDDIDDWQDQSRPVQFGFDEYCLWQLTRPKKDGERYADPLIEKNGEIVRTDSNSYGPDIFADFILDFIARNAQKQFFVYYPMVLVHDPFVPTPDSDSWNIKEDRYKGSKAYFKDMVEYADKITGRILNKLEEEGLLENTVFIFTGDNGTNRSITTQTLSGAIQGGKGNTTDAGTRVPLIVHWPKGGQSGKVYQDLISFCDFYPTLAELADLNVPVDGQSFFPVLSGLKHTPRETLFVHYDPRWGNNVNQFRNQFIRTLDYKLYSDGRFISLKDDVLEMAPLALDSLNQEEKKIYDRLKKELDNYPDFN